MRGGPRGGLWSEEKIASSGTGSERAQGRERSRGDPSASQGPRDPALATGRTTAAPGTGDPKRCGGGSANWAGTFLSPEGGTLLNVILDRGMSPQGNVPGELGRAEPAASGRRSRSV